MLEEYEQQQIKKQVNRLHEEQQQITRLYEEGKKLYEAMNYDQASEVLSDVVWSYYAKDEIRENAFKMLKAMAIDNGLAKSKCGEIYAEGGLGWIERFSLILNGFTIVEPDYKIATDYFDEAIKRGIVEAAEEAVKLYYPEHFRHKEYANTRKSLEYCIKGIRMGSSYCLWKMFEYFNYEEIYPRELMKMMLSNEDNRAMAYAEMLDKRGFFDKLYQTYLERENELRRN